jgi:hypothetical protein
MDACLAAQSAFMINRKIYVRAPAGAQLTPAAAIADLELEEAELLNRLRSTQEKQRLAYR